MLAENAGWKWDENHWNIYGLCCYFGIIQLIWVIICCLLISAAAATSSQQDASSISSEGDTEISEGSALPLDHSAGFSVESHTGQRRPISCVDKQLLCAEIALEYHTFWHKAQTTLSPEYGYLILDVYWSGFYLASPKWKGSLAEDRITSS